MSELHPEQSQSFRTPEETHQAAERLLAAMRADSAGEFGHLMNVDYSRVIDSMDPQAAVAMAAVPQAPNTDGYKSSASVGKSWEQIKGVNEAVDAARLADGKPAAYYGTQSKTSEK